MKLKSKKGFTLMEMLIVVAIIGVLAAIAIPVVNVNLNNAKKTADDANFRAAKASSTVEYLNETYNKEANTAIGKYFKADGTWTSTITEAYQAQYSNYSTKPYILAIKDGGVEWAAAPTPASPAPST